ncbi:sugar nucleotide-binding protein, partial [bacterium]|nr:sugar nucleotide-binding protein [bacterium]
MSLRILITGVCGMLGMDLWRELESKHELYGMDIKKNNNISLTGDNFQQLDITDMNKTYELITKVNPQLVIHTAAYTDVDGCETNKDFAYKVNMLGTRNIALACQRFDAA